MPEWKQLVRERLARLRLAPEREAEIVEELALDLEQRYSEARAGGAWHAAALQAALDELGNSERVAQAIRDAELANVPRPARRAVAAQRESAREAALGRQRGNMLANLSQDLHYGLRILAKNPGFTLVAVLTLALGIGANTAIFSVIHAVVLQPLAVPEPERLMTLSEKGTDGLSSTLGYPTFTDWRARTRSLESAAAIGYWNPVLSSGSEPVAVEGSSVSGEFFRVMGVASMLGRVLTPEDDRPNNRIVVISYAMWTRHFNSDRKIVGRPILLNGIERQVIGVMPREFPSLLAQQNKPVQVWRPLAYSGELAPACRTCRHLSAIARLRPGVTREQAEAELNSVSQQMKREHPTEYAELGAALEPMHEYFTGKARRVLAVLFGAVGFVLLVACVNVASLILARAAGRQREWAVRVALGAGRGRIAAQVLTENLLLAIAGGATGLVVAVAAMRLLIATGPAEIPRIEHAGMNTPVALFALGVSLLTGLLFGIAPALQAAKQGPHEMLKEGGRGSGGQSQNRLRGSLVIADVALALVLLVGAGLMLKSVARLLGVNPGFSPEHVQTYELSLFGPKFVGDDGDARVTATYEAICRSVAALSGVRAAGATTLLPLGGNSDRSGILVKDKPIANPADAPSAYRYGVTHNYLEAMAIPLRRGRLLGPQDTAKTQPAVVVNETFAKRVWPGEDPIGKFVQMGGSEAPWRMVVGVVGDVRHAGLDEPEQMQFYAPEVQWMWVSDMTLVVRATGEPQALAAAVREAVWSVEKNVRIGAALPMSDVVRASYSRRSFVAELLGIFAAAAVLLAAIGIYGVMSQAVAQRTAEIGIRMALGAQRSDVLRMILGQSMRLVLVGVAIGIAVALALTRSLQTLLFDVQPSDPMTYVAVAVALAGVALLASYVPAWRAARTDPMEALRYE